MRVLITFGAAILATTLVLGAPCAPAHAADAATVATVGGTTITRTQLEDHIRPKLIEIESERFEALREGLDELVAEELFKQEAKARKITLEELVKTEVTDKIPSPSDADIQKLYEENKEELQGQPLETLRPQIVQYLSQAKAAERRDAFITELKAKYKTTVGLKPPIVAVETAGRPEKGGGAKAPVTIVMFSDYECPFCKRGEDVMDKVMETYGDKIRLVFRDYPLPMHPNARPAAEAANCAHAQGKFWDYHRKLFSNQSKLTEGDLKTYAKDIGLDEAKFAKCLTDKPFKAAIDKDVADGEKVGVSGTPAFFINGRMLSGAQPFEKFKETIDDELAAKSVKPS